MPQSRRIPSDRWAFGVESPTPFVAPTGALRGESCPMLGFFRNAIILSAIALVLLALTLSWAPNGIRPRIWQLNELLQQDEVIAQYPYDFRVLTFLGGVATITSPRASTVPEEWYLTVIDPALAGKAADAPEVTAARERLYGTEMRIIALMLSQDDIDSVVWTLDRAWYHRHGVKLPPQAEPTLPTR